MPTPSSNKVLGFILLAAGLLMIILSVWGVYSVFSGAARAPAVIPMHAVTVTMATQPGMPPLNLELLKAEVASQALNMAVLYALMAFVLMAGSKIASLGTGMLTPRA